MKENNYDFVVIDDKNTWAKIATLMMHKLGIQEFVITEEDKAAVKEANPSMLCKFVGDDFVMQLLSAEQAAEMQRLQAAEEAYALELAVQEEALKNEG